MGAKGSDYTEPNDKKRIADVPSLIIFIGLMTMYIGVAIYAVLNGQVANSFTYIHNLINHGVDIDSTAKIAFQMMNELYQARFVILSFIVLAVLWSISTIAIVRKTTCLTISIGTICEVILLIAIFVGTICASQSRIYQHSSSRPYLFFPLFIAIVTLKLLAVKEVGLQFLSNILGEACRVITIYWFALLTMLLINISALSSIIFGFYIYFQLMSTSLQPLYSNVQTEDGTSLEITNFVIVSIPSYIYLFHAINIISSLWLNNALWYFGYAIFSRSFVELYQNPEEKCNSIEIILARLRTIIRYHIGTIIYAASPYAFVIQISAMWKYALNNTNEYLRQKPFIGSISWIVTVWNLPDTAVVLCSFHKTGFKQSAKLVARLFIHNPIRLLTIYAVLEWISFFVITFVTIATSAVFAIFISLTNYPIQTNIVTVVIIFGAAAMTRTVYQLFRIAVLSIYVFMVQNIERLSDVENKKPVNPAIERIIAQCRVDERAFNTFN